MLLSRELIFVCTSASSSEIKHLDIGKQCRLYSDFKDYDIGVFSWLNDGRDFDNITSDLKIPLRKVAEGKEFIVEEGTIVKLRELNLRAAKEKILCCETC